jgi:hypothetical protein
MYTINIGLDIEKIQPTLWKTIILTQKCCGDLLQTCLYNSTPDLCTVVWVSERPELIDMIRESLGISSISSTEEITEEEVLEFSPGLLVEELLVLARTVVDEKVLDDNKEIWIN